MPSSLQYKKIYFDSKFRSLDCTSSSDLKFELPETMTLNENTVFYLDDICIPHSWDTVIAGINDKLYFKLYVTNEVPPLESHLIATIEPGNYIGPDLASEIQTKMNAQAQTASLIANIFTCAYIAKTNKISITCLTSAVYSIAFRIITQPELKTIDWTGPSFDRTKPNDFNEIIGNLDNISIRNFSITPYMSGFNDLAPFNNIYIHATNLGNYNIRMKEQLSRKFQYQLTMEQ